MTIAVCPGSFDPMTLGHLDVVRRARSMFDEVVVGVARNAGKSALLTVDERLEVARAAVAHAGLDGVRVARVPGLLVEFCREIGAHAVVKGLRGGADFDAEVPMALMNRHLAGVVAALACQVKAGDRVVASRALFGSCRYVIGQLLPRWGVETVFVIGDPALAHVASSLVKDVARHGGDVDDLVPPGVGDVVRAALARTA